MTLQLPSTVIFVHQDDGALAILSGIEDAQREYEAIDVENGEYRFYNYLGHPLSVSMTRPVEHGTFLGLFKTVAGGEFTLVEGSVDSAKELRALLPTLSELLKNPWFPTVDSLTVYLSTVP